MTVRLQPGTTADLAEAIDRRLRQLARARDRGQRETLYLSPLDVACLECQRQDCAGCAIERGAHDAR